jgi:hypothetical protein
MSRPLRCLTLLALASLPDFQGPSLATTKKEVDRKNEKRMKNLNE